MLETYSIFGNAQFSLSPPVPIYSVENKSSGLRNRNPRTEGVNFGAGKVRPEQYRGHETHLANRYQASILMMSSAYTAIAVDVTPLAIELNALAAFCGMQTSRIQHRDRECRFRQRGIWLFIKRWRSCKKKRAVRAGSRKNQRQKVKDTRDRITFGLVYNTKLAASPPSASLSLLPSISP